jgi:hypothetical protein
LEELLEGEKEEESDKEKVVEGRGDKSISLELLIEVIIEELLL